MQDSEKAAEGAAAPQGESAAPSAAAPEAKGDEAA